MRRLIALLRSLAAFLAGCGQTQAEQEQKAVDAILKLGGKVERDERLPGRPVVDVNLRGTQITDAGLKELKELKDLRSLNLTCTQITEAGLKELKELKGLQALELVGTEITAAGLKDLKDLKGLQTLEIGVFDITDTVLKDLYQALPNTAIEVYIPMFGR